MLKSVANNNETHVIIVSNKEGVDRKMKLGGVKFVLPLLIETSIFILSAAGKFKFNKCLISNLQIRLSERFEKNYCAVLTRRVRTRSGTRRRRRNKVRGNESVSGYWKDMKIYFASNSRYLFSLGRKVYHLLLFFRTERPHQYGYDQKWFFARTGDWRA